jgi:hypothetical protein
MNRKSINEVVAMGRDFANLSPEARPYLSPLWETIAKITEYVAKMDGEAEARDVAFELDLHINTARHYLTALVDSGFPITREELRISGNPMVYSVDSSKIKILIKLDDQQNQPRLQYPQS